MSGIKWTCSVFLLLCLLFRSVSTDVSEITVKSGDDVTLPCRTPRDKVITVLTWTRPDLETDDYVFFYRNNRSTEDFQLPSYRGRVQLKDPQVKDGNVSVVLKNTKIDDTGTYECRVPVNSKVPQLITTINLKVENSYPQIPAHPGDDVTLPCRAPDNVAIATVEWTRSDLEGHVYMKSDGHVLTADQDPSYKNRVQLKDDEMKNGDLSLVLKKVKSSDGGTYVCLFVGEGGGFQSKLLSIVYLKVAGPGDGGQEGGRLGVILPVTLIAGLAVVAVVVAVWTIKKRKAQSVIYSGLIEAPDVIHPQQKNKNRRRQITLNHL